jgi:sulfite reductase (ferredoxin)
VAPPPENQSTGAAPVRAARPSRPKGQGQWALGHLEPLNPNERVKKDDNGLNVRARINNIYSKAGFQSIDPADLRGRMRWWGLYTQRAPGIDGGRTATLEPEELDDEFFMLRVRSDGGRLNLAQLRAIADISEEFGRDTADITDRQNVQLHWIRIEDVPAIWERLEAVGLMSTEACGDTPRVILGSPVAGIAADEIIDGTPAIEEIVRRFVGDPAYSNLPRKFKSAISGSPHQDVAHEINCISFVGVVHPEHGPGFDLYVGGGLSTNPMYAKRLGAWIPIDDVPDVWEGVIRIYREYGYRRMRTRARIKFLVADWGPVKFREMLESDEFLGRKLIDGPPPAAPPTGRRDHVGVHPQTDGNFYIGVAPTVGRVSGAILNGVADIAEAAGSDRIRLSTEQKFVMLDVPAEKVDQTVAALETLGLEVNPSEFRRSTMACTGIEYCKLAIVETKARASDLIAELEDRLPTFNQPLTLHVNGCPNSCARFQVADIGFKGSLVQNDAGETVEGFQVHLGGALGPDANFGRKLRAHKVTADGMPDYVERLATTYLDQRDGEESFAEWTARADESDLR